MNHGKTGHIVGFIGIDRAGKILKTCNRKNLFLLRFTESMPGTYITIIAQNMVQFQKEIFLFVLIGAISATKIYDDQIMKFEPFTRGKHFTRESSIGDILKNFDGLDEVYRIDETIINKKDAFTVNENECSINMIKNGYTPVVRVGKR